MTMIHIKIFSFAAAVKIVSMVTNGPFFTLPEYGLEFSYLLGHLLILFLYHPYPPPTPSPTLGGRHWTDPSRLTLSSPASAAGVINNHQN